MGFGGKKVPLKNIVNYGIRFAGNDERKLKVIHDFILSLVEKRLNDIESGLYNEVKFLSSDQKKIELKADKYVESFVEISEIVGKSASGLLCELLCEKFGIKDGYFKPRKPKEKKKERRKTISFKIPMRIYSMVEDKISMPISFVVREIIREFLSKNEDMIKVIRERKIGEGKEESRLSQRKQNQNLQR